MPESVLTLINGGLVMKRIASFIFIVLLFISCSQPLSLNRAYGSKKAGTGSLTIVRNNEETTRSNLSYPDRKIIISEIERVRVVVSGDGFSDIVKDVIEISNGRKEDIIIENIPAGNNRIVSVQAMDSLGALINGVIIRAVTDIKTTEANSVSVNWDSTALGNIFFDLLKSHSFKVSEISQQDKNKFESIVSDQTISHSTFVNYAEVASDYKNNSLKDPGDISYIIPPSTALFSISNVTDFEGYKAQVTDPASSLKETVLSVGNSLTGITPGNWRLLVYRGSDIVYKSDVKEFKSNETTDFGIVDFVVSKPFISPESLSFLDQVEVTMSTTTEGAAIRYTVNGDDPSSTSGILYEDPIAILETTTIKAIAYKDNFINSEVSVKTYTKQISNEIGKNHPESGAFSPIGVETWGTASWDLGSNYTGSDVTFAVYSKNATKILLEIYETETSTTDTKKGFGTDARYDYWMAKGSDNIWRAKLKDVPENTYYAFRVWGPNWTFNTEWTRGNSDKGFISDVDDNGNRFNPNKVVFDPYARELSHDKEFPEMLAAGENGGMYGTGGTDTTPTQTYNGISRRNVDTGRWVPKGIILKPIIAAFTKPSFPEEASTIYEAHVRGISAHNSASNLTAIFSGMEGFENVVNVPEQYRGTYKGAAYLAKYLKAIGINTIEFLPVHETENDLMPFDGTEPTLGGAKNFWGYMTYGFFAPDRRYAHNKGPGGPTKEFQEMVQAFNAEGIKVFLDVVYNHTGEGGNWGHKDVTGFVSMGGFDAAEYYHLVPGGPDKNILVDGATGCGNQVNFSRAINQKLVLDSLTYWIDTMGMCGFRFDLAAVLGRDIDKHAWEPSATYWDRVKPMDGNFILLKDIADLGQQKNAWMIAEAWDIWAYPVGQFPNRWGEWNGRYRDAVRKYMSGNAEGYDGVTVNNAFHGDWANFNSHGGPHKSINFLVAHDGFTLADLVSYNEKQNTALTWPFGPSDGGSDSNISWDSNIGGTQTVAERQALRRQRLRNFWTFQMFSRGTPMIVYGDEITRTQNGNNNPYNVDSVMTWNNYNMINTNAPHTVPTGYGGVYHNNLGTSTNTDGKNTLFQFAANILKLRRDTPSLHANNYDETIGYEDIADTAGLAKRIWRGDFLICSNMHHTNKSFFIPESGENFAWRRIIDTDSFFEGNNNFWADNNTSAWQFAYGIPSFTVNSRSTVVFRKVPINPADGLKVNIKIPADWGTLTDLQIGRRKAPSGDWDGWYRAKSGTLTAGSWQSLFLYPYGTADYSFILSFNEDSAVNEIFLTAGEAYFDIANNKNEVWIDMSSLNWINDGPPKKFWTNTVTYTAP